MRNQQTNFLNIKILSIKGIISKLFVPKVKRNGFFSVLFDFKISSTIWNYLSVTETFLNVNEYPLTKICFTLKLQKKSFRKKSVPFYKHYRFVSDPFDIRYDWICKLGNIGMVCTVFKYISLKKRYLKLLIKLGTDFEVGKNGKRFRFVSLFEQIIWRWSLKWTKIFMILCSYTSRISPFFETGHARINPMHPELCLNNQGFVELGNIKGTRSFFSKHTVVSIPFVKKIVSINVRFTPCRSVHTMLAIPSLSLPSAERDAAFLSHLQLVCIFLSYLQNFCDIQP
jgi:hypothetical protein